MQISIPNRNIYAIAGPTASGKTELGVKLAQFLGGEVINCDSVQIYKEIMIATAKPTPEEMRGVPHHLIGYVDPRTSYTATEWASDAAQKIVEIESRGKTPILVGGTGFYLRTLVRPIFDGPKPDWAIRLRIQELHRKKGAEYLYKLVKRLDPLAAEDLFERDYPRTMRAIEYRIQTGRKISEDRSDRRPPPEFASRLKLFVLEPPRDLLYSLINERTNRHFELGLVQEVEHLRLAGIPDSSNALGAHGYRRVCEFLRGERSLDSAVEKTQQDIRNYAKRQLTWFRSEKDAISLQAFGGSDEAWRNIRELVRPTTF